MRLFVEDAHAVERDTARGTSTSPLTLLSTMHLIRIAESRLVQLFADGEVPGFIHLSIGQEAIAAGLGAALERRDTLSSTHRGHGHALAKGIALDAFFLELMGKAEGVCKGRGGSMHVADMRVGMLGANGIVAAGIPIAVGSALAHRMKGNGAIAAAFFGDGALAEGVLHESFNLAALWKLPVLFVCENNGWSEFSPTARQVAGSVTAFAAAHGIGHAQVDGNDAEAVAAEARRAVDLVRATPGPFVLECITTRLRGHFEGDPQKYRSGESISEAAAACPIARLERRLLQAGISRDVLEQIAHDMDARVTAAVDVARRGTMPGREDWLSDVYASTAGGRA